MKAYVLAFFCIIPGLAFAQHTITSTRFELNSALDSAPDTLAQRVLLPYKTRVHGTSAEAIGYSQTAMTTGRPESLLGNWAADAVMEYSDFANGKRADLCILNLGSMRSGMPEGELLLGDVENIIPYEDYLVVVSLRGSDLLTLMGEIAIAQGEAVSKEVRMSITKEGAMKEVSISGKRVENERIYSVVTLDYLADGYDKLPSMAKALDVRKSNICIRDVLVDTVRREGTVTSHLDGRIRLTE